MNTTCGTTANGPNRNRQLNILIICCGPLGFTTDAYELSKYLTHKHSVTYLCFRVGETVCCGHGSVPEALVVKDIDREGRQLWRAWKWLISCIKTCREGYDLIYLYYFPLCSLVRLACPHKAFILDVRSGSVVPNPIKRRLFNLLIRIDSKAFNHISVLCESMRKYLHLPSTKTRIIPLGANPMDIPAKKFSYLHLLYVGTFFNRSLDDTIKGFAKYYSEYSEQLNLRYTLVGDSPTGDRQRLSALIQELGLQDIIDLPGYIPRDQLKSFFERCNIGVSYVPIVPYYDCQPPTKTLEYLFTGIPVIATATTENRNIVNDDNGVLIDDTPEGFYKGLCKIAAKLSTYDSQKMRDSVSGYSWHHIMVDNALPFIETTAGHTPCDRSCLSDG